MTRLDFPYGSIAGDVVTIPRALLKACDSFHQAFVLHEIAWWSDWKDRDDPESEGWFYRSYDEWKALLGIDERTCRRVVKLLADRGLIESVVRRVNGITIAHYRIMPGPLQEWLDELEWVQIWPIRNGQIVRSGVATMSDPERPKCPVPYIAERHTERHTGLNPLPPSGGDVVLSVPESSSRKSTKADRDRDFEAFWQVWPKEHRVEKKAAQSQWEKIKPCPELVSAIMAGVERQQITRKWLEGYVPAPHRWLRGERWTDEVESPRGASNGVASTPAERTRNAFKQYYADLDAEPVDEAIDVDGKVNA